MGRAVIALLALFCFVQSASAADSFFEHYTLLEKPGRPFPKKLIVLSPQVSVKEISAGGVLDLVPEWTAQANANIQDELKQIIGGRPDLTLVPAPAFTPEEKDKLDQYVASYMVVGLTAYWMTNFGGSEWAFKRNHFDYTLGEGLSFVRQETGADAAIMVIAEDYVSSSGRKAAMFLGALMGVGLAGGQSVISVGVVDLDNGDILWMHHSQSGVKDLKDRESVHAMLTEILADLPRAGGPLAQR